MIVKNETNYDTRYLRRLFIACEKHEGCRITNKKMRGRWVKIKKSRNRTSGYAWLNSTSIVMKLPPNAKAIVVAQVYIHELGHNLGLRHNEMPPCDFVIDFWPDELIPLKKVKAIQKRNIIEVRAEKAQKKLNEWTRKLNRAKTYVKKYQVKVRYYEKKQAATKK